MSAPVWSKFETHCVLCLRPFATSVEEERHADRECGDPCWCLDFCWVDQGGDCVVALEGPDELALLGQVRGEVEAREAERDAYREALEGLVEACERDGAIIRSEARSLVDPDSVLRRRYLNGCSDALDSTARQVRAALGSSEENPA